MDKLVKDKVVSETYEDAGLKEEKNPENRPCILFVKGYVVSDDPSTKTVNSAHGVSCVKEDVMFGGHHRVNSFACLG